MHELSITQNIVDICQGHAQENKVKKVTLEIGALAGVVSESIEFCFEGVTRGTVLEGAILEIDHIAGSANCPICQAHFPIEAVFEPCPRCGQISNEIITGKELRVREITLE